MRIEPAGARHVPGIAAIYAHAARTSAATFDLDGLPEEAWHRTLAEVDPDAGRLLLVALDDAGEVLGYSKSGEHKSRPAYASTCETSVYLAEHARRRGVGGALYDALLERLDESPLRLAVGGVAEPNEGSTRLHLSRGYERVGTFTGIGVKYAREWDVTWYQRRLATPRLVRELEGLVARGGGYGEGMAIVEARERPRGGTGERLILEWCAEVLAPVRPRDAGAA